MIGRSLSHYTILEKLGEGGMGVVYLAEDTELKRKVALKFLSSGITSDKEAKKRFTREAQTTAALNHPNIITIYEIDEFENQTYISMEYVEGKTLRKLIDEETISVSKSLEIAEQICSGLEMAHQSGIVHRDIKPENIIIDNNDRVKILDFGLAKLKNVSQLTKESSILGTVKYMSPEQARGGGVDKLTDIWSLGVVLFEMLSGEVPFKGDYEQAVIYSILNEDPQSIKESGTDIPEYIEAVVRKCLTKQTSERYASTTEVQTDLAQQQKSSPEGRRILRGKSTIKRRLTVVLLTSIILISIIVAGYYFVEQMLFPDTSRKTDSLQSRWENSIAVLPFENISPDENQEYFCDGMTEQIISSLSRISRLKVISRTSIMKFKNTNKTIPEIAGVLNVNFILEGSVRKSADRIRVTAQLIDTKTDFHVWSQDYAYQLTNIFNLQDDLSENIINSMLSEISPDELVKSKSVRPTHIDAYEYFLKGKYYHEKKFLGTDSGEEAFKLAEMMFKKSIDLDSSYALPHIALADLYHSYYVLSVKEKADMQVYYNLMNEYLNKAISLDSTLGYNHLVKGRIHSLDNNINEAYISFKKAVRLKPNSGWMNQGIGSFLFNRGLHNKTKYYADKSVDLDPLEPRFYVFRGINYQWLGQFEIAEANYLKALQIEPQYVNALENYIHLLIELKRLDEADRRLAGLDTNISSLEFLKAKLFAARGEKEKALQLMENRKNLQIIALLGLKEEADSFYKHAIDQDRRLNTSYYWLYKTSPCYDKLRDDPRFQEFIIQHKKIYEENLVKFGEN